LSYVEQVMAKSIAVGDTFTHVRECDRYRPIYYAAASGDFNPIHIDPEAGKAAGLGGVILQGLCTLSWAVEAAVRYLNDPTKVTRVRVRFSRPVFPEDTVTFTGKVTQVEGDRVTLEIAAKNQKGDDVLKGAVVEARV
jgi:acyl dehydratase